MCVKVPEPMCETGESLSQALHYDREKYQFLLPLAHPVFTGHGSVLHESHRRLVLWVLERAGFTIPAEPFASYETLSKLSKP